MWSAAGSLRPFTPKITSSWILAARMGVVAIHGHVRGDSSGAWCRYQCGNPTGYSPATPTVSPFARGAGCLGLARSAEDSYRVHGGECRMTDQARAIGSPPTLPRAPSAWASLRRDLRGTRHVLGRPGTAAQERQLRPGLQRHRSGRHDQRAQRDCAGSRGHPLQREDDRGGVVGRGRPGSF
jgi:hypothetical protein